MECCTGLELSMMVCTPSNRGAWTDPSLCTVTCYSYVTAMLHSLVCVVLGVYGVLYWFGAIHDGVYNIKPWGMDRPFPVYCDMKTDGGGWTVIQRRYNGQLNFHRNWDDYRDGFGNHSKEHWLGLEKIHQVLSQGRYSLRIDIEDFQGDRAYALYDDVMLGDETDYYRLSIAGFSGNASDSMSYSNGRQFSSRDVDRDGKAGGSCATQLAGGWWFNYCSFSNLNGPYYRPEYYRAGSTGFALFWRHWKGWYHLLKKTKMLIRSRDFKGKMEQMKEDHLRN
ncbi:microfibril-associated glycoprotein 4-like [Branchiostoma floridae x Branchiostoma belcheri]